jgi:hypothetical protein
LDSLADLSCKQPVSNDQARPEPLIDAAKLSCIFRRYSEEVKFWEDDCSE